MYTFNPTLYFITDSTGLSEEEFLYRVECALDGGATLIQLREKDRTTREYIHLAYKVHSIARRYNVPLIVDDRCSFGGWHRRRPCGTDRHACLHSQKTHGA